MQKKRLLVIVGSVLAAIIIALLIIPSFIDWGKYQSVAQQKLKDATGYDLTINGSFRMAILPSPHASANSVVIKKPVAGHEDTFLTFENADVRIALLPLLMGKLEIASVTLDKPVVTLVTYKDGGDNYTPVKPASVEAPATTTDGKPAAAQVTTAQGQSIAVNGFRIKDGRVILRNEATNTAHEIGIDDLHVKADTLSGPFDGDGKISYGRAHFDVSITTGGYKAGETLPVQLAVSDKDGRADLKWSGVVATGNSKEFQGEMNVGFGDLAGLLADIGVDTAVPSLGDRTQLSGMLTVNPDHVGLTNGNLVLGKTKFKTKVDVSGLKSDAKTIVAIFDAQDMLDVNALMKVADKVKEEKKEQKKDEKAPAATSTKTASAKTLLPTNFTVPAKLKADIQFRARGLEYNDQGTGAFETRLTAADGKGDVRATVAELPGGGNLSVSASTNDKGAVEGTVIGAISSLKSVLSDWLKLVDAKTLNQPGMPRRIDMDSAFTVSGNTALVTLKTLSLGEPKITGTVAYTAGARPLVNAKLAANIWTLPVPETPKAPEKKEGESDKSDAKKAAAPKIDFDFNPPQLPFDLKFDVVIDRLVKGDFVMTDARAAGDYDGKGLNLSTANGTVNGGTLSASGRIADLKALSGIDAQAGLKTSDLESFVQAMSGKPLGLKEKIGDFTGTVKAKGDRKKMAVDATMQAHGYTVTAAGTLDDPFSPEIPGTMAVRIRHNDLVNAIRVFSPGFGNLSNGPNKPIDIAGTAKISGKVYEFADMKGILGGSDIAGSLKADLSGAVPSISADLTSKKLDVGSLVGVDSKAASSSSSTPASSAGTTIASSSASGQWSREPLDTGFMKSINVDIKINAGTLTYGTWTLTDAKTGMTLKNGVMKVAPIAGKLYGGTLDATLNATTAGENQPLNMDFKADVNDVAIGPFLQALTASSAKRADGTGSLALAIKGSGISSAALMGSLDGKVSTKAKSLVIYGMDIDKLAANIVEAFDGGWKGVLAGFTAQGFSSGQTKFKDVDQSFIIANGDMPIQNFKLETSNGNAIVVTNGTVSFARWMMDLQSNVQVTQPKDVPVIGIRLAGPLDSPTKSVSSQALDNLVRSKLGDKVQDLLGDKLKDSPVGGIVNQFLGGGNAAPAPTVATTPPPATPPTDASAAPAPAAPAPAAAPPAAKEKTPQEQLLEGVLNRLSQ